MSFLASATTAAAQTAEKASLADALPHLLGMVMVFATLAILWGLCALTAKLVQKFTPAPAAPIPATAAAPAPIEPLGPTPEIIAAITAAVTATVGAKTRIISIRPDNNQWGSAGRQSVLTSHRIRK